jgi:hypothetical protein
VQPPRIPESTRLRERFLKDGDTPEDKIEEVERLKQSWGRYLLWTDLQYSIVRANNAMTDDLQKRG